MAKSERQLVTPLEKLEKLPDFEGRPVVGVGIEVPGMGGGLRDALTIDPVVFHYGDTVHLVVRARVGKLRFDPVKDAGQAVRRVHVLDVDEAAIVSADAVADMLEKQALAIEEARGLQRLPFDEMSEQHEAGEHASGLVDGCPACDEEAALAESEAVDDLARRDELADRRQAKEGASDG